MALSIGMRNNPADNGGKSILNNPGISGYTCSIRMRDSIRNHNTAIVLITPNQNQIDDFTSIVFPTEDSVGPEKDIQKLVYTDTDAEYLYYFDLWVNPKLIEIDKNGKVIYQRIFNPADMDSLEIKLLE